MRKDPNSVYLKLDYEREKYASDRLRLREFNHKTQEWGRHVTPNQYSGCLFSFDEDHDSSGCREVYGTGDTTLSGAIHKIVEGVYGPRYRRRPSYFSGSRWGRFTFALRDAFRAFHREHSQVTTNPFITIEYEGEDANGIIPALSFYIQKEMSPHDPKPFELDLNESGACFTALFEYGARAGRMTFYLDYENGTKQSIEIEIYERVY